MTILYEIKLPDGSIATSATFNSYDDGDAWVTANSALFPDGWTLVKTDITTQVDQDKAIVIRTQIRERCNLVIDYIANYNKNNLDTAGMQTLFSQPWFAGVALALLLGAPATAQGLIKTYGTVVYPQDMVDAVAAMLEPLK